MPWCPNCKNEYREGTLTCADCGADLVPALEIPDEPELLFAAETKEIAEKFTKYLDYTGLTDYELKENDFEETEVYLPSRQIAEGKKLLIGFRLALENNTDLKNPETLELPSDDEERGLEEEIGKQEFQKLRTAKSSLYVKSKDRYNDMKFSGISFIVFAIIGLALIILNNIGVFHFLNAFSMIIMTVIFILFFFIGITTLNRANQIKDKIGEEESKTDKVKVWMRDHFKNDYYDSLMDDSVSIEKNYFVILEQITNEIKEAFPDMNPDYLEQLADENFNVYLDHRK